MRALTTFPAWSHLGLLLCFGSACATPPMPAVADAEFGAQLATERDNEVEALRRELMRLDAAIAARPDDPSLRRERGRCALLFAQHERAGTAAQRSLVCLDAIADLERALASGAATATKADATATRVLLATANAEAGRTSTACAEALALLAEPDLEATARTTVLGVVVSTGDACRRLPTVIAALHADDAESRWFRGKARYLAALHRANGDDDATVDRGFAEAEADFAAAMASEPRFLASSRTWSAMCLACRGQRALAAGRLDEAEALLRRAVTTGPDALYLDLGDGDSLLRCLLRHGDRIMRDFGRTEAFFHTAFTAAPNDPDLANNAAVYARDHGYRLAKAGRTAEAQAMFARSYATYRAAVALMPDSVRLRNDCALVAIHYLHDDLPAAGAMLQAAIADGERQLAATPVEASDRHEVEEALGDCFENLALWHLEHTHDRPAAARAAQRALTLHPGPARAGARSYLAAALADDANGRLDAP